MRQPISLCRPETITAVARVLHAREGGGLPFEGCPYCPALAVELIEFFLTVEKFEIEVSDETSKEMSLVGPWRHVDD